MSHDEAVAWERRYAEGEYRPRSTHSPFLEAWLDRLPPGRALDLGAGTGRHAIRLAEEGYEVEAVDISPTAIRRLKEAADRRGVQVNARVADLDEATFPDAGYDVITAFRFVHRPLFARIPALLRPDGWVLVEHHLRTHLVVDGPPERFRLAPGELLETFASLRIVFYEETVETSDDRTSRYVIARMAACKGDPGW